MVDRVTGNRKGFCFVIFADPEAVEEVTDGKIPPQSQKHEIKVTSLPVNFPEHQIFWSIPVFVQIFKSYLGCYSDFKFTNSQARKMKQ